MRSRWRRRHRRTAGPGSRSGRFPRSTAVPAQSAREYFDQLCECAAFVAVALKGASCPSARPDSFEPTTPRRAPS
eukprot:11203619-Lingulodinium_polyedra.AAC.1